MLDTLVVGGGLAGLSLAWQLDKRRHSYRLLEARDRLGGRILSEVVNDGAFDLGPAWFWPGQSRMASVVEALGLQAFEQYANGALLYEDEHAEVHRGVGYASMAGSLRVSGGLGALIAAIAGRVASERIALNTSVTRITPTSTGMRTDVRTSSGEMETIESRRVVLALPPRVAAARIGLADAVSADALAAMKAIPTWMAGHAKVVAVYSQAFWRTAGLSGDAMSRVGPMAEIHDASPAHGGPYALFGFVGVPAAQRRDQAALLDAAKAQLVRIFGDMAGTPLRLVVKDWALEPETATELDQTPPRGHPAYGLPPRLQNLCDGKLLLGSTEVGTQHGGFLEGALEAAERCLRQLTPSPIHPFAVGRQGEF